MLTLKELKGLVREADEKENGAEGEAEKTAAWIVAGKALDSQAQLTVFWNGRVLYRAGRRSTVFRLCDCGDYAYRSQTGACQIIREELFEQEAWYIRLVLEGEERLTANQERMERRYTVPYDAGENPRTALAAAEQVTAGRKEKEQAEVKAKKVLGLLTPRQSYVLARWYGDKAKQRQIAAELGVSQQAVADLARKAKQRINRVYGAANGKNGNEK